MRIREVTDKADDYYKMLPLFASRTITQLDKRKKNKEKESQKHTTGGIPRWSPTLVLVARFSAYVWQSGRDAQFSLTYGRMCWQR